MFKDNFDELAGFFTLKLMELALNMKEEKDLSDEDIENRYFGFINDFVIRKDGDEGIMNVIIEYPYMYNNEFEENYQEYNMEDKVLLVCGECLYIEMQDKYDMDEKVFLNLVKYTEERFIDKIIEKLLNIG